MNNPIDPTLAFSLNEISVSDSTFVPFSNRTNQFVRLFFQYCSGPRDMQCFQPSQQPGFILTNLYTAKLGWVLHPRSK